LKHCRRARVAKGRVKNRNKGRQPAREGRSKGDGGGAEASWSWPVCTRIYTSTSTGDTLVSYVQLQLPECLDGVPAERKGRTGAIINSIEFQ